MDPELNEAIAMLVERIEAVYDSGELEDGSEPELAAALSTVKSALQLE